MNTEAHRLTDLSEFVVVQKFSLTLNRYEIRDVDRSGQEGEVLAVAAQERTAFREHVTFFADEDQHVPAFSFRARRAIDLGGEYDVLAADGEPIGWFSKDAARSLVRSTWQVGAGGLTATGTERSAGLAVLRRVSDLAKLPFHFDFTTDDGRTVMTCERAWSVRDRYHVTLSDRALDPRVAAAMAVALDALEGR